MSLQDVIRAWKDEDFRLSLSAAELAQLPANPAGLIELEDADLEAAAGGRPYHQLQRHLHYGGRDLLLVRALVGARRRTISPLMHRDDE